MKHLKKFEELNKATYLSAADKLSTKGHKNRANALRDYAKDIIVSNDDFTFYVNRGHETVNPKIEVAKITDIEIEKLPISYKYRPERSFSDKIMRRNKEENEVLDHYNLILVVKFSNGKVYKKEIGTEHISEVFGGSREEWLPIIFTTRQDAVKFVRICNAKIDELLKHSFYKPMDVKPLNVNDFYKN